MKPNNLFKHLLPSLQVGVGGRLLSSSLLGRISVVLLFALFGTHTASAQEAYAVYSSGNTLTFYYDTHRNSRTGTIYDLPTGNESPGWQRIISQTITNVVFDSSFANARPTSTFDWFAELSNLTTITGIENLNTSEVTRMEMMFSDCSKLTSLDLSSFNTANVTNMGYMFSGCSSLTSLDLSSFNTAKVTYMFGMFRTCSGLTNLDLSSFNTAKVENMGRMFEDCTALTSIYVGSGWSTSKVSEDEYMFSNCTNIVGGVGTRYDATHVNKTYARIDGGTNNPGYLTDISARQPYVIVSDNNTKLTFYYDHLKYLREGTPLDLNTGSADPAWIGSNLVTTVVFDQSFAEARPTSTYRWFSNKALVSSITGLEHLNTSQVTNMESMFENCYILKSLDLNGFNTSSVTNMRNMFSNCRSLTSLNVKDWDTGNVTDMYGMFFNCAALTSLNVRNWNTGKVTNMQNTFSNCSALTSLDVSNWNTANVTITLSMFESCSALTSLDLNNWNTNKVDIMFNMFKGCSNLTSLKVSNWNTSKVTDMGSLFQGCGKLTTLDLSGWNTALVTNMSGMFYNCSKLRTISVGSGWSTGAVTSSANMFYSCTSLVGGAGTPYSSGHLDAAYAHLDGGADNPGYLSGKPYAVYNSINQQLTFYFDGNQDSYGGGSSTVYYLNNDTDYPSWTEKRDDIKYVNFDASFANARPTRTSYWFDEMTNLESITNIENLNTSEVTTMSGMFYGCSKLRNLDLSNFDTGNVTSMSGMFYRCSNLANLKVNNWNTSNVTNMSQMFFGCSSLTSLDLISFNTANVQSMSTMFQGCSNLTTIYASNGWNVEGVIYSDRMFKDCTNLVGGAGTTFDADMTDKTYARLDGFNGMKGYLSAKPYVVLSSDNKTLTFYCNGQQNSSTGTVYNLNTGTNDPGWYDKRTSVTTVVFDASFSKARPTSTYRWFGGMTSLTTITKIRNLNTSSVTNMKYMFSACNKLTSLDLSSFNTENVTDMYGMFYNCTGLTSLDVSSFNTANVTLMTNMFYYCSGLTTLDLSNFNTAKVTSMYQMFIGCSSLKTILASGNWKTEQVTSSNSKDMFKNCDSLEGSAGTTFKSTNPTDKTYAHIDGGQSNPGYFTATPYVVRSSDGKTLTFYYDGMPEGTYDGDYFKLNKNVQTSPHWISTDITTVVFDPSFADAQPTNTNYWFYNLRNLETITGLDNLNTSMVTNMNNMFQYCQKLTSLNLGKWNTANVIDMQNMFYGCSALVSIMVGDGWNTGNVTNSKDMFYGCESLVGGAGTTFNASHVDKAYAIIDGGEDNPGYLSGEPYARYGIYSHELYFSCDGMRSYYENNSGYNVYDLNTGSAEPSWYDRHAEINTVRFDWTFAAARPTSTCQWFKDMTNIVGIDGLQYLNTSEVTDMGAMFSGCSSLTTLDLSGFNTAKVTNMASMFYNCTALTSVDLSGFDTSNTMYMPYIFSGCSSLTSLDLSSFNTSNVTSMSSMFAGCSALNIIYVGNSWNINKVNESTQMFSNCLSLVGGAGTTYKDANPKDKTYAHVDGGTANPGYLTDISAREGYAIYTSSNNTLTFYYDGQRTVRGGYALNKGYSEPAWYANNIYGNVTTVVFDPSFADARPTSTSYWFQEMENLTTITGLEYLNTSEVTNMAGMFNACSKLTSIDLSHFDTSKVTDMNGMFNACSKLTILDLLSFNTANVEDMSYMFYSCRDLTSIIVAEGWSTEKVSDSDAMFMDCTRLKGGAGTAYNGSNPTDKTYAHIDCGTVSPGYLSALPYVVLNTETQTITYYSDGKKGTHTAATEVTCDLNGENFLDNWLGFTQMNSNNIKYAIIDPSFASARLTSMEMWFMDFSNLESITGMEYLNTSAVTDMRAMFGGCSKLTSLDLSHFDTSNVTDMSDMFNGCSALTGLDVSGFNTENVTNMNGMFLGCTGLTGLYLSSFNTANVATMRSMFYNCSALTTICVGDNWSTSGVSSLSDGEWMFTGCTKLVGGNGTRFSTDHVDYDYARIDATGTPGYFTAESQLPTEAYAVISEDLTTLTFYNDKLRHTRTNRTFDLNTYSNEPDWVSEGTNASVTNVVFDPSFAAARPMTTYDWFYDMKNLTSITGIGYLNTSEVTDMYGMFRNCKSLTSLDLSSFNTANVTDMCAMFMGCELLTSLDLSSFNTANVTDMYVMFAGCKLLTSLDLSNFNTANVTDMVAVFHNCSSLTSLDLSSFNTANVTDMDWMFFGCSSLTSLDLSSFNTANVTDMNNMFYNCSSLTSLDVSSFNTEKVTDMNSMFSWCPALTALDVSSFNTAKVTNMAYMFSSCSSLTSLDVSSFNTEKVTDMNSMFSWCPALTTIYVGTGWNTAKVTSSDYMFYDSHNLVGGNGTRYDSNHTDAEYAHVDVVGDPGYFTAIPYVVLSTDGKTLTFYHDGVYNKEGTVYNLSDWSNRASGVGTGVTTAVFDPSFADARPIYTTGWFYNMANLTTITGMEYLNTSEVTAMTGMFAYCSSLTTLDLSSFNTANVNNMVAMFSDCTNLKTIYVGDGWSTDKVTLGYGSAMFTNCTALEGGNGTAYATAGVEDVSYACIDGGPDSETPGYFTETPTEPYVVVSTDGKTLTFYYDNLRSSRTGTIYELNTGYNSPIWDDDVRNVVFDPSFADARPTSTYEWFSYMHDLTTITGIEYLNTSEVIYMDNMFYGCSSLTSLDVSNFNTENVTRMADMFNGCSSLTSLDLSSFNTEKVTTMSGMFDDCSRLTSLDLSSFNTEKVTNMKYMFSYCRRLTTLNISSFNTANVTDMEAMFFNCNGLSSLDVSNFNTAKVTDMSRMFENCLRLTTLDVNNFNTQNVQDMAYMFSSCHGLTTLDISSFNTTKVRSMLEMFSYCEALTTIYVGTGWNTDAVSNSSVIFPGSISLVGGNGTTYDADHVNKEYARIDGGPESDTPGYFTLKPGPYVVLSTDGKTLTFYHDGDYNKEGTVYNLSDWDTRAADVGTNVTTVVFDPSFADARPTSTSSWFAGMTNLTTITGISNLNTSEVTNMATMFFGCSRLTILDLSSFNTANVENMTAMFNGCTSLTTIYAGDGWSTGKVTSGYGSAMFTNCTALVGGMNTPYDAGHVGVEYAHVDGGPSNPGYFTYKASFMRGDVNGDNKVDVADITALTNHLLGIEGAYNSIAADVDGNGEVTSADVPVLVSIILGR